ncbi:hypothetical protein B0H17DRAFT_1303235, partial [Mycena rosella]
QRPYRLGEHHVMPHDFSTLHVLGSIGELNWYNEHVGKHECAAVDMFWFPIPTLHSSTAHTIIPAYIPATFPSAIPFPLHPAFIPLLPSTLTPVFPQELEGNNIEGVLALKTPWPLIMRTIWQDHARYLER